jgi:hypothetical protein
MKWLSYDDRLRSKRTVRIISREVANFEGTPKSQRKIFPVLRLGCSGHAWCDEEKSYERRIPMKHTLTNRMIEAGFLFLLVFAQAHAQTDPLPSWNDGPAKKAIVEFVKTTTEKGSPKFVAPESRIAAFDQDGTTWVEHPMYTQIV